MKIFTKVLCGLALALGVFASAPALAHHTRAHFGFYFGGPVWYPGPYYYPPPAYYYPPPTTTVYVEQPVPQTAPPAPQSSPQSENSWYYCRDSQTYYPYVKECASPWQRVAPRPPGS